MLTLLLKDARQTMWPAILAFIFLLTPPLAWLSFVVSQDAPGRGSTDLRGEALAFCVAGALASLIAGSSIAGVAFAKERRERTAEFLATLPIPRWKVVLSKAVTALLITALPLLIAAAAWALLARDRDFEELRRGEHADITRVLLTAGAGWLTLFGLGWGLSAILRSDVLASATPIVVLIVVPTVIVLWSPPAKANTWQEERAHEVAIFSRIGWSLGALGAAGLAVGTVIALKRRSV